MYNVDVAFVRAAASLLSDGIRRTESHVKTELVFTYLLVSFYLALYHASYSIYLFGIAPSYDRPFKIV